MIKLNLNENFICRIWEEKSYYRNLTTLEGEKVTILNYGRRNYDSGPDYKDARVKVGQVIYSGSIEIHRSMHDWYLHHHSGDNKYNELILHIVFYQNENGSTTGNFLVKKARKIPTVVLSEFLTSSIHEIWKDIINNPSPAFKLPCYSRNSGVPEKIKSTNLEKLSKERLVYKSERIDLRRKEISNEIVRKSCWEQVLYEFITEALGYSKNKQQFYKFAKRLSLSDIKNLNLNRIQIDALVFGLSGFLQDLRFRDTYIEELKTAWKYLREILRKEIMDKSEWTFFRLRPSNFPTIRLAYASGLLFEIINNELFKKIIKIFEDCENPKKEIESLFRNIPFSDYWNNHYNFGIPSGLRDNIIGYERITAIITNILLPFVYLYSIKFNKTDLRNRMEYFYQNQKFKGGSNEVTRIMAEQLNLKTKSLSDEQGLIHLHNFYCVTGRCNECEIGKIVFSDNEADKLLKIILY